MTGTIDIKLHAEHPDEQLPKHYVFAGSPTSPRIVNVPQTIGEWEITTVHVSLAYPDNTLHTATAVLTEDTYVATLPACATTGVVEGGFEITADGIDESGEAFEGLCLGVGDLEVLPRMGTVQRGGTAVFFRILDAVPASPHRGDAAVIDGSLRWYDGTSWIAFGGSSRARDLTDLDVYEDVVERKFEKSTQPGTFLQHVTWCDEEEYGIGWHWTNNNGIRYLASTTDKDETALHFVAVTPLYHDEFDATQTITVTPTATGLTLNRSNQDPGGLAKFGAGGVLETATNSSDASEFADYRDPLDNVCHMSSELGEWTLKYSDGVDHHWEYPIVFGKPDLGWPNQWVTSAYPLPDKTDPNETVLVWRANQDWDQAFTMTATRQRTATKGEMFVTKDYVDRLIRDLRSEI